MAAVEIEQGLLELEAMPEVIAEQVGSIPAARWDERVFEGEGGWSRRQLLAHLVTINLRHAARVRRGVDRADPNGLDSQTLALPIDEWNREQVQARDGRSIDDLLLELRTSRRDLVQLLRSLTPEQRERFRFPRGEASLDLAAWIPFALGHDREHLADIVR